MMVCKYCNSRNAKSYNTSTLLNRTYESTIDPFQKTEIQLHLGHNALLSTDFLFKNYRDYHIIPINYCPMCGRKLRENNNMIDIYEEEEEEEEDEEDE